MSFTHTNTDTQSQIHTQRFQLLKKSPTGSRQQKKFPTIAGIGFEGQLTSDDVKKENLEAKNFLDGNFFWLDPISSHPGKKRILPRFKLLQFFFFCLQSSSTDGQSFISVIVVTRIRTQSNFFHHVCDKTFGSPHSGQPGEFLKLLLHFIRV